MATANTNGSGEPKALFAQVQFYIECSQDLSVDAAESVGQADSFFIFTADTIASSLRSS